VKGVWGPTKEVKLKSAGEEGGVEGGGCGLPQGGEKVVGWWGGGVGGVGVRGKMEGVLKEYSETAGGLGVQKENRNAVTGKRGKGMGCGGKTP